MTYEQIEKSVDESFTDQFWVSTQAYNDKRNEAIKSFLKRSFIKYLQNQIDFIDDKVREEIKLETVEMCDVYLGKLYAYDEIKKSLQAQIKEIETCK